MENDNKWIKKTFCKKTFMPFFLFLSFLQAMATHAPQAAEQSRVEVNVSEDNNEFLDSIALLCGRKGLNANTLSAINAEKDRLITVLNKEMAGIATLDNRTKGRLLEVLTVIYDNSNIQFEIFSASAMAIMEHFDNTSPLLEIVNKMIKEHTCVRAALLAEVLGKVDIDETEEALEDATEGIPKDIRNLMMDYITPDLKKIHWLTLHEKGPKLEFTKVELQPISPHFLLRHLKRIYEEKEKNIKNLKGEDKIEEITNKIEKDEDFKILKTVMWERDIIKKKDRTKQMFRLAKYVYGIPSDNETNVHYWENGIIWTKVNWDYFFLLEPLIRIAEKEEMKEALRISGLEDIKIDGRQALELLKEEKTLTSKNKKYIAKKFRKKILRSVFSRNNWSDLHGIQWENLKVKIVRWEELPYLIEAGIIDREEIITKIIPNLRFRSTQGDLSQDYDLQDVAWDRVQWDAIVELANFQIANFSPLERMQIAEQVFQGIVFADGEVNLDSVDWEDIAHFRVAIWLIDLGVVPKDKIIASVSPSFIERRIDRVLIRDNYNRYEYKFWNAIRHKTEEKSLLKTHIIFGSFMIILTFLGLLFQAASYEKAKKKEEKSKLSRTATT